MVRVPGGVIHVSVLIVPSLIKPAILNHLGRYCLVFLGYRQPMKNMILGGKGSQKRFVLHIETFMIIHVNPA